MKTRFVIVLLSSLFVVSISFVIAQGTCPQIVEQALQSLGDNCDELSRNSACYGYNLVSAQFSETVEEDFFTVPADTSELSILESIQTAEMDTDLSQWGVAVMSVQANIPNSIPGQAARFVLLGDVEVESAVEPDNTYDPADAIAVTLSESANIRSGPGLNFNVTAGATAGDTLSVDAQNEAGTWYRVVINEQIGWIFGELLESTDTLSDLPVIDGGQRSLMQAFYLRTGFGAPQCDEAPSDTLVVQGPQNINIDLTVNGADIQLGSTIAMRILPPGNIIEFTVIDGTLTIIGGGPDGEDLVVFENFRTTACLDEPDDRGVDGNSNDRIVACEFTTPEFVPELDLGQAFCVLENVPEGLFNYAVDLECPDLVQGTDDNQPDVTLADPPSNNNTSDEDIIGGASDSPPNVENVDEPDDNTSDDPDIIVGAGGNNLCFEGNAWGDGRCQTDYDWQAGFYYGQVEAGIINVNDIPAPFYVTPTPQPTASPKSGGSSGLSASLSCGGTFGEYVVTVSSFPSGDTSAEVFYEELSSGSNGSSGIFSLPGGTNWIVLDNLIDLEIISYPSNTNKDLSDIACT